jgi:hypothetical protein
VLANAIELFTLLNDAMDGQLISKLHQIERFWLSFILKRRYEDLIKPMTFVHEVTFLSRNEHGSCISFENTFVDEIILVKKL